MWSPATSSFIIIEQFMAPAAITAAIRFDVPLHCVIAAMTFDSRRGLGRRANFTTRLVCVMAILWADRISRSFGPDKHNGRRDQGRLLKMRLVSGKTAVRRPDTRAPAHKIDALRTIETLLDYAMLESAELGLPTVVCLLRMARLELETQALHEEEKPSLSRDDMHQIRLP
jgi:hypothetical protein